MVSVFSDVPFGEDHHDVTAYSGFFFGFFFEKVCFIFVFNVGTATVCLFPFTDLLASEISQTHCFIVLEKQSAEATDKVDVISSTVQIIGGKNRSRFFLFNKLYSEPYGTMWDTLYCFHAFVFFVKRRKLKSMRYCTWFYS